MITTTIRVNEKVVGKGKEAKHGQVITVHYTGWLFDETAEDKKGEQFDCSKDRGSPLKFILGVGMVIEGWDKGLKNMKEGGKRTLTIPASMAYGEEGSPGAIPPNSTLIFDVELLTVQI